MIRRLAVAGLVFGCLGCARPAPQGQLRLYWSLPHANMGNLQSLEVEPIWAGAGLGGGRNTSWQAIDVQADSAGGVVRFPTADDQSVLVASGRLPAGQYSHVYAAAGRVRATRRDGQQVAPEAHIEPIALPVTVVADAVVSAEIELIVLERAARRGGSPQVFVKDAHVVKRTEAEGTE